MIYPHPATIYPDPREVGPQRETVARSRKFSVFQCFPRLTTMCPHNYSRSTTIKSSLGDTILRPRIIKELAECTRGEEGVEKDKSLLFVFEVLLIFYRTTPSI